MTTLRMLALSAVAGSLVLPSALACDWRTEMPAPRLAEAPVQTLAAFGAIGDGTTDDTKALVAAFNSGGAVCLDGETKTYRVDGTLRARAGLCLRNAVLRQTAEPVDTRPFIRSARRPAEALSATDAVLYPEDRGLVSPADHERLMRIRSLRTILVTADGRYEVVLENVKVDRGAHATLGSASEAAGIFVVGATSAVLRHVEVTGQGRGNGIAIVDSRNVRLDAVNVHDLVWALEPVDQGYTLDEMQTKYRWNSVPIYVYSPKDRQFAQVRSQEQTNGIVVSRSENVAITNSAIDGVLFETDGHLIPWQGDGITVGRSTCVGIAKTRIARTWEGIDLTGQFVTGFRLRDLVVDDSFAFGLKLVHAATDGAIERVRVARSGFAGIVIAGTSSDVVIAEADVTETGILHIDGGATLAPWVEPSGGLGKIAGIGIWGDPNNEHPSRIAIVESSARNIAYPGRARFGIRADSRFPEIVVDDVTVEGAKEGALSSIDHPMVTFDAFQQLYRSMAGCDGDTAAVARLWLDAQAEKPDAVLARAKAAGSLTCDAE